MCLSSAASLESLSRCITGSIPAHFHAIYGGYEVTVEIKTGTVNGKFPRRALAHVLEWNEQHKAELLSNWELARRRESLDKVAPLE